MNIRQIHGKELSYNNYNDIFAALTISKSLPNNTGTVILNMQILVEFQLKKIISKVILQL